MSRVLETYPCFRAEGTEPGQSRVRSYRAEGEEGPRTPGWSTLETLSLSLVLEDRKEGGTLPLAPV